MNTVSELVENYNGCKCTGGGGGDFTTCMVTIINNSGDSVYTYVSANENLNNYGSFLTNDGLFYRDIEVHDQTETLTFIFFGESGRLGYEANDPTVTGNATIEESTAIVTGDCTLTFSD